MSEDTQIATDAGVITRLAVESLTVENRLIMRDPGEGPTLALLRDDAGDERLEPVDMVGGVRTTAPGRIATLVAVETEQSLAAYANRFKTTASTLFASIATDTIVAVIDYHGSTRDVAGADGDPLAFSPSFREHRVTLKLVRSLEWLAWAAVDGKLMPQLGFVRFLEENREDIHSPDAATILEACRDLQGLTKVDFRSVVREDSDNYKLEYAEEATARPKGDITLPSEFILSLPVYFDDVEVQVAALLRWKIDDGHLSLGLKLKRAERIRQAQFKQIVVGLHEATGLQALYGSIPAV